MWSHKVHYSLHARKVFYLFDCIRKTCWNRYGIYVLFLIGTGNEEISLSIASCVIELKLLIDRFQASIEIGIQ